ncbi:MOSC domain-containing protein [Chamaesiphon minutus]|uniref:Putative Fe-S protein n=1 Tax=Chamaesiphon minutus (strain ATCC 27169 / PCC 6605) TaxID=1173020 RepID=K9UJ68_CHAP6|nr:MOSC N-terminal beta barrel domain-containing protein [Chamaesiphon minutus]AFY94244.1 putative Fe-S protein [Chamaesiphon minutus PCC 6605]
MTRTLVGKVASLWRYPVKSMLGERLEAVTIAPTGVLGDRAYALWDCQTQRIASAKNPHKWAKLLQFQATFVETPQLQESMPPVSLVLPDGSQCVSNRQNIDAILSQAVGRDVQLLAAAPETPSLDQYWPDLEGAAHRDTITQLFMPAGTFFDSCPIHAITTATLARLQELYPEGEFAPARFRPNMLIEPTDTHSSFVENDWVGSQMTIGDEVTLSIDTACPRCVVTTVAQSDLPIDLNILRTTARHNNSIAGIRASVVRSGSIRCGDLIWLD